MGVGRLLCSGREVVKRYVVSSLKAKNKRPKPFYFFIPDGGWSEIRTHGGRQSSTVFKTVAFNRSAIHPHRFVRTLYLSFFSMQVF